MSPSRIAPVATTTTTTAPVVPAVPEVVEEIDGSLLGNTTSKMTRPSPTNKKPVFNIVK